MISVMAAVMAIQAALIYQVENRTASAAAAGIGAAAMLFVFQGAFTIGFQATVWVYPYVCEGVSHCLVPNIANMSFPGPRCYRCGFASVAPPYPRRPTGCSTT